MLKEISKRSRAIFLIRSLYRFCLKMADKVRQTYRNSYLHHPLTDLASLIKKKHTHITQYSGFIEKAAATYKRSQKGIVDFFKNSVCGDYIEGVKKELARCPFKATGVVLISAVAVDLMLSFVFQRKIEMPGLVARTIFLSVGLLSLLCKASWTAIKESSILLRILFR